MASRSAAAATRAASPTGCPMSTRRRSAAFVASQGVALQAGGQLPGRRRLPVLRRSRPRPMPWSPASSSTCCRSTAARTAGGRRPVLRRGRLHPRVLHHGEGVPGRADAEPRLRRAAARRFGANLLFPSGSRAIQAAARRSRASWTTRCRPQLRAIPHNAILMQLGLLANSVGGAGRGDRQGPGALPRSSTPRSAAVPPAARRSVTYGASASNPAGDAGLYRRARPRLLDHPCRRAPATASWRTGCWRCPAISSRCRLHERQSRVFRALHTRFHPAARGPGEVADEAPHVDPAEPRRRWPCCTRSAWPLIQEIFLLAMRIPRFSSAAQSSP